MDQGRSLHSNAEPAGFDNAALDRRERDTDHVLRFIFSKCDLQARLEAVTELGERADPHAVRWLVIALQNASPAVRGAAAHTLASIARRERPDSPVWSVLGSAGRLMRAQALHDTDPQARGAAASALAAVHRSRAVEMMSPYLGHPSSDLRMAAVHALAAMRFAVGSYASDRKRALLSQALDDPAPTVRQLAAQVLEHIAPRAPQHTDGRHGARQAPVPALASIHRAVEHPVSWRERLAFKLAAILLLVLLLGGLFFAVGSWVYQPKDLLPSPTLALSLTGFYGPNEPTSQAFHALLGAIDVDRNNIPFLRPVAGDAYKIPCRRGAGDVLFGKRRCETLVFRADASDSDLSLRFLIFRDAGQVRSIALAAASAGVPNGQYFELPEIYAGPYPEVVILLRRQATRALDKIEPAHWTQKQPEEIDVFLPFIADPKDLQITEELLASNPVLRHLMARVALLNPQLSLGCRVFTVAEAGAAGVYYSSVKMIQRSMYQEKDHANLLAHELVHAALDGMEDHTRGLENFTTYLRLSHPQMLDITLPLFYAEQIAGPHGDYIAAEEAIAFLTGALAAERKRVYFFVRRQSVVTDVTRDLIWLTEPLLADDIELLIELGLVPAWMSPRALGYEESELSRDYYELAHRQSGE